MTARTNLVHPTPIADLVPFRPALVQGVVVRYDPVCERTSMSTGGPLMVRSVILRDSTGHIELTLWNEEVWHVQEADRILLVEAWVRVNEMDGRRVLSLGSRGYLLNLGPASGRGPVWHPDPHGIIYVWGLVRRRLRERDLRVLAEGGRTAPALRGALRPGSVTPAPPQLVGPAAAGVPPRGGG